MLVDDIARAAKYYSLFNYPLTGFESWKYFLRTNDEKRSLREAFLSCDETKELSSHNGFWIKSDQSSDVSIRASRYVLALQKYKKVLRTAKILAMFPFVRLIAVNNTLALSNSRRDADLDLFIVTSPNRIWLARFFLLSYLAIMGLRPRPQNTRDKFCLSFFVTEDRLNLQELSDKPGEIDYHFAHWIVEQVPIYDAANYHEQFCEDNRWAVDLFNQSTPIILSRERKINLSKFKKIIKKLVEVAIGNYFTEVIAEKIQKFLLPKHLAILVNQGTSVVIGKGVLKFHENDRRREYNNKFKFLIACDL